MNEEKQGKQNEQKSNSIFRVWSIDYWFARWFPMDRHTLQLSGEHDNRSSARIMEGVTIPTRQSEMSKIVEIARAEIGNVEFPANSNLNKYGKWFGWDGVAWCAMFVSYCYAMAGKPIKGMGWPKGFAGCQAAYAYFRDKGLIVTDPEPGDIVLFDWNGDKRYDHTGIFVEKIDQFKFKSIEGNTSLTNDSNGGEVMERSRNFKGAIFARFK